MRHLGAQQGAFPTGEQKLRQLRAGDVVGEIAAYPRFVQTRGKTGHPAAEHLIQPRAKGRMAPGQLLAEIADQAAAAKLGVDHLGQAGFQIAT